MCIYYYNYNIVISFCLFMYFHPSTNSIVHYSFLTHVIRYMDNNLMEEITRNTFAPVFNLRVLRMGNNNIHTIEDGAFLRQPYLFQL